MMSRRAFALGAMAVPLAPPGEVGAVPGAMGEAIGSLYRRFVAAQNARDLAGVRALLSDAPDFLWVSDGRPFWGADTMVARMATFQEAPVWRVTPDYARARTVALAAGTGYLLLPLLLEIGPKEGPSRLPWLVGVVCTETAKGWRIAALFTTTDKAV